MIIAVVAVPMMQCAPDDVIRVRAVRDGFVAAVGAVLVLVAMPEPKRHRQARAVSGVPGGQGVLIDVVAVLVVQVAPVQVIGVLAVGDGRVAAAGAVDVLVFCVDIAIGHQPTTTNCGVKQAGCGTFGPLPRGAFVPHDAGLITVRRVPHRMVQAPGVRVPRQEAESTRQRLAGEGLLRVDLKVARDGDAIIFPVSHDAPGAADFDFAARDVRPASYHDLLDWSGELKAQAPRAFDQLGDLLIVKVPPALWDRRDEIGEALLEFQPAARAVYHDAGVTGEFRTRDLTRIAGEGATLTTVRENGVTLFVDVAAAYFSPRLSTERARVCEMIKPGQRLVDLFGGVAPMAVQAALRGADVDCVDLNPAACELARRNIESLDLADRVRVHEGDARYLAPALAPAEHVVMNLPHAAKHFIDAAAPLVLPGGILHHHEILDREHLDERLAALRVELQGLGRDAQVESVRVVRTYSPQEDHVAIDLRLA